MNRPTFYIRHVGLGMIRGVPVLVLACLTVSFTCGYPWRVSISPPEVVTISHGESVTILCQTKPVHALVDCGFQIAPPKPNAELYLYHKMPFAEILNLTANYDHKLSLGMCRLRLNASSLYKEENFPVGCRLRARGGGWEYGYTSIIDTAWLPNEITLRTKPNQPYHLPGSNLTVHCDSTNGYPLEKCSFTLPRREKFDLSPTQSYGVFRYVGDGLDKHQCGIDIPNINDVVKGDNDMISCETFINYRKVPTRELEINIARCSMDDLKIQRLFSKPGRKTESAVNFHCVTPSCSPPATIYWHVNGSLVTNGSFITSVEITEEPVNLWRWQRDEQRIKQVLTLDYVTDLDGLVVECFVEHPSFTEPKRIESIIPDSAFPWWVVGLITGVAGSFFLIGFGIITGVAIYRGVPLKQIFLPDPPSESDSDEEVSPFETQVSSEM